MPCFFREFIMNTLILLAALSSQITFQNVAAGKYDHHYSSGHPGAAV
jgi:hypothetical protein